MRDEGILGAFHAYRKDGDFDGFKMRIIHKVLTPTGSRENRSQVLGSSSSAATAGFPYQSPHTAVGGFRKRPPQGVAQTSHDRYMPIVLHLEQKGLLNEVTSSLLKTLILEENVEIQRVLDAYSGLNDRELSFKLIRLAQQQVNYHERPQSPLPKRKHKLMNYVNSLAEYYFRDPNDVKLL